MSKVNYSPREEHEEWTPITFLNLENRSIGWSPGLKKSVYIDESTEPSTLEELKRIREADVLIAYDQVRDRTRFIELKESEREEFDSIYSRYLEKGGQISYTRKKIGRKTHIRFMLEEEYGDFIIREVPEKRYLFE
ncbi:MAG: hypothetical protein SCH39_07775 [Methanosarcinales archaeon]|nr:hypothetical protein [Methanosarcinales archaeon]